MSVTLNVRQVKLYNYRYLNMLSLCFRLPWEYLLNSWLKDIFEKPIVGCMKCMSMCKMFVIKPLTNNIFSISIFFNEIAR